MQYALLTRRLSAACLGDFPMGAGALFSPSSGSKSLVQSSRDPNRTTTALSVAIVGVLGPSLTVDRP